MTTHELLGVLTERAKSGSRPGERTDGYRVVLSVEGGGMRGTLSAGMAHGLHELGLTRAFDAVYGSSAGAITGAWLLSSNPDGLRGWARPDYARALIRWSGVLRGRPVVDVRMLVEEIYQTEFPMDFTSILASEIEYHPLATDAATGESTDLRPLISDPVDLRLALRASASLPFLAGPPVQLDGRRFYDAGIAESIPFRTPLAHGATHLLVLRSRRPHAPAAGWTIPDAAAGPVTGDPAAAGVDATGTATTGGQAAGRATTGGQAAGTVLHPNGSSAPRPPRSVRLLARTTLRNESPELRAALLTRGSRTAADIARITELQGSGQALMIFPPEDAPPVSRLTTDDRLLAAAFNSGRNAILEKFRLAVDPKEILRIFPAHEREHRRDHAAYGHRTPRRLATVVAGRGYPGRTTVSGD